MKLETRYLALTNEIKVLTRGCGLPSSKIWDLKFDVDDLDCNNSHRSAIQHLLSVFNVEWQDIHRICDTADGKGGIFEINLG